MTEAVVFDTNVLPLAGGLSGPLWLSIRKLCDTLGVDIVIPEIVVHESVNLRREQYAQASAKFLESFRAVERFFDAQPVYVPDVDEVGSNWEKELRRAFRVVATHGDDAAQALEREARRTRPARDGRGARDSAIWLTVLRQAATYDRVTLVSRNTSDFGVGKDGTLHPDLVDETQSVSGAVIYVPGIDPFVESLATAVAEPELSLSDVTDVLRFDLRDKVHAEAIGDTRYDRVQAEELEVDGVVVGEVRALRSYLIAGSGLALARGTGAIAIGNPRDGRQIPFEFGSWIEFDIGSGAATSGELHTLRLTVD